MNYLIFALGGIAIVLFGLSLAYAVLIYHRPFPSGWTWASVVIGNLIEDIAQTLAILATLTAVGRLDLWWMSLFPISADAIAGTPMIVFQIKKLIAQLDKNRRLGQELE